MKTITYNDETAPWSRVRWFPSYGNYIVPSIDEKTMEPSLEPSDWNNSQPEHTCD
jgi:hypothetical protein